MPAGNTYEAIATQTLGSNTASITFSSISGAYTDLVLVITGECVDGNNNLSLRVGNGSIDSGTNYSYTRLYGYSSTAGSGRASNTTKGGQLGWGTNQSTVIYQFMNYSNTTTNKTVLGRNADTEISDTGVTLWRSTAAINTITVFMDGSGLLIKSGTTCSLYGIKAA
jgi:hypothetical protein